MGGATEREPTEGAAPPPNRAAAAESRPSRIGILETEDGLGIYNPSRRSWLLAAFLAVWMVGWAAGEAFALMHIVGAPLPVVVFLAVWGSLWTVAGIGVGAIILWHIGGAEALFLTDGSLVREVRFFGLTRRSVVPLDAVTDFSIATKASAGLSMQRGRIRFRAAGKPASFGIGLDDREAKDALAAIEDYCLRKTAGAAAAA